MNIDDLLTKARRIRPQAPATLQQVQGIRSNTRDLIDALRPAPAPVSASCVPRTAPNLPPPPRPSDDDDTADDEDDDEDDDDEEDEDED